MSDAPASGSDRNRLRDMARTLSQGGQADPGELSAEDVRTLVHELGVYQVELETQNEELRETRLKLEEARDRYRELYEFAPVGYFTFDRQGTIIEANLTGSRLLRTERGRLIGQYFSQWLDREDADALYLYLGKVWGSDEPFRLEVALRISGKAPLWVRMESIAATDTDGRKVCRAAVSDISAEKKSERDREARQQLYRSIFARNHAVMLLIDSRSGEIIDANPAACAFYGYPKNELTGRLIHDINMEPPKSVRTRMEEVKNRTRQRFECRHRLAGGDVREVEVYSGPLDRQGKTLFSIVHDISDRKQAEREMKRAQLQAEDASRAKSEFLANMSHEIRTPLTIVFGALEQLRETSLPAAEHRFVEMAENSAHSLLNLINDILDISRIEARKVEIHPEPFLLGDLLRKTVDMFQSKAEAKKLGLTLEVAEDLSRLVYGDADRLRQILVNLIGNAIKFTEKGEVKVTAEPCTDTAGITIAVTDTGIGIPPNERDRLFDSFTQADSSRTRKYGGTGLGLSISKGLVQLMGGEIVVESEEGRGSTFRAVLPLPEVAPGEAPCRPEPAPVEAETPCGRILLAEDDPQVRHLIELLLRRRQWEVVTAGDGLEALSAWQSQDFDLLIVDVQMPGMDGLTVTRKIREQEGDDHRTPIIALTAHAREEDRQRCLQAGMDSHASKPIDTEAMYRTIERLLPPK